MLFIVGELPKRHSRLGHLAILGRVQTPNGRLQTLIRGPNDQYESAPVFGEAVNGARDGQRPTGGVRIMQSLANEAENRFRDMPNRMDSSVSGLRHDRPSSWFDKSSFSTSHTRKDGGVPLYTPKSEDQSDRKNEQRTVLLQNLPESVTHRDIVDIIRGGLLLDVYLRTQDRSASVSFVDGSAAQALLSYAKRNGVYVRGRRVCCQYLTYVHSTDKLIAAIPRLE